ncbi:cytoplasmic protein, partial [Salmonella enterica]|nr:cytoplasmic protein [Salmonella enterica]
MDMSLTKPVSAEQPCGPDPEYDPEYLLLFSRAAPQAEAQYGDFVSTPEAVNWPEI